MPQAQKSNYAQQIEARKKALKQMETARIQAESDKKHAESRLEELETETRNLGYDPDPEKLREAIAKLDREIEEGLEQVAQLIPSEYRN